MFALRRPVRLAREGREVDASLSLSAASFALITSSQKEAAAFHALSLSTIALMMAASESSPSPDCPREGQALASPCWALRQRMLRRVLRAVTMMAPGCWLSAYTTQKLSEATVPGKYLRQPVGESAMTPLQPTLHDGPYRRYKGVPYSRNPPYVVNEELVNDYVESPSSLTSSKIPTWQKKKLAR